jgi:sigma-B regulation protein RsbU (phosphoserine phosphatase)
VRQLSSAVEQTADPVLIADRDGRIAYVNEAFEELTGYASEELLGQTPRMLRSGEQGADYFRHLWSCILDGRVFRDTLTNRRKDGRLYHVEQTITPMRNGSGEVTHFVSIGRDMTERLKLQERDVEMRLAARVQQRLYPAGPPRLPGLDVAGTVLSAEMTCGDYIDYIPLGDRRLAIAIGDVSGHGLPAAFVMAKTRAYLRSLTQRSGDIGEILTEANRFLTADLDDNLFVTLLVADIDVRLRRLVYANAGHVPAFVLDDSGEIRARLTRTGLPLGIAENGDYRCGEDVALAPGDVVTFYTDGLTECRSPDGGFFDEDRLVDIVRTHRREPARRIVERLGDAVTAFRGGGLLDDDVSIVVCSLGDVA